jgi:hypothetical protein
MRMAAEIAGGYAIMEPVSTERQARIEALGKRYARAKAAFDAVRGELTAEMRAEYSEDKTPYETIARLTPLGTTQVYRMINGKDSAS